MATLLGPFSVGYPVAFRSGGDLTREAFGKHIQEIEKIYGILNALDAGKLSSTDMTSTLKAHIDSTSPHPNWKPSINFNDISGNLDASKITGSLVNATIPATNVIGNLTQATIDSDRVNGLKDFVNGLINTALDDFSGGGEKGDGIIESNLGNKGYIKFNNGLIVNWGNTTYEWTSVGGNGKIRRETYAKPFSSECYALSGPLSPYVSGFGTAGFEVDFSEENNANVSHAGYIAIGI